MKQYVPHFLRNQKGAAFIEFALVFPFMFLLLFGGVELSRYILIIQRVEKATYVITDIVGQYPPATDPSTVGEISVSELNDNILGDGTASHPSQLTRMMGVFGNEARQGIILSSVINVAGNTRLRWQRFRVGAEIPADEVRSVVTNAYPTLTAGDSCTATSFDAATNTLLSTMTDGESMIVGEIFFRYQPIVGSLLGVTRNSGQFTNTAFSITEQTIVRRMFIHPRNGELVDLPPAHPVIPHPCE